MKKYFFLIVIFFIQKITFAQSDYYQHFDGEDTAINNSIFLKYDTNTNNIWQIGKPQKQIFNSAYSVPNVLITDTINSYPINNQSSFNFKFPKPNFSGIIVLQWLQKLDMTLHHDGGIIEFRFDSSSTWENIFNNPKVYTSYGFLQQNKDTLITGEYAFSGTDSIWRDVWVCFYGYYNSNYDTMEIRFTFKSDSIFDNKEGWMIDNMFVRKAYMHPIHETTKKDYIHLFPNPTNDIINIDVFQLDDVKFIDKLDLINSTGTIIKSWKNIPCQYWIDLRPYSSGNYFLKIKTKSKSSTLPFVFQK